MEHYESLTELDEEVYDEMRNFMKCLVAAFDKLDQDVIFLESAVNLKNLPHTVKLYFFYFFLVLYVFFVNRLLM